MSKKESNPSPPDGVEKPSPPPAPPARDIQTGTEINKTIPCKICGSDNGMDGTKLCNNCWEIDSRIDALVRNKNGLRYLMGKCRDGLKHIGK